MDAVASALVDLILANPGAELPALVNLVHPRPAPWDAVLADVNAALDVPLRVVPFVEWLRALDGAAAAGPDANLDRIVRPCPSAVHQNVTDAHAFAARNQAPRLLPRRRAGRRRRDARRGWRRPRVLDARVAGGLSVRVRPAPARCGACACVGAVLAQRWIPCVEPSLCACRCDWGVGGSVTVLYSRCVISKRVCMAVRDWSYVLLLRVCDGWTSSGGARTSRSKRCYLRRGQRSFEWITYPVLWVNGG